MSLLEFTPSPALPRPVPVQARARADVHDLLHTLWLLQTAALGGWQDAAAAPQASPRVRTATARRTSRQGWIARHRQVQRCIARAADNPHLERAVIELLHALETYLAQTAVEQDLLCRWCLDMLEAALTRADPARGMAVLTMLTVHLEGVVGAALPGGDAAAAGARGRSSGGRR